MDRFSVVLCYLQGLVSTNPLFGFLCIRSHKYCVEKSAEFSNFCCQLLPNNRILTKTGVLIEVEVVFSFFS